VSLFPSSPTFFPPFPAHATKTNEAGSSGLAAGVVPPGFFFFLFHPFPIGSARGAGGAIPPILVRLFFFFLPAAFQVPAQVGSPCAITASYADACIFPHLDGFFLSPPFSPFPPKAQNLMLSLTSFPSIHYPHVRFGQFTLLG